MVKVRTDFSRIRTRYPIRGRYGDKTRNMELYEGICVKNGIYVPGRIPIPREFFIPLLQRIGILDEKSEFKESKEAHDIYMGFSDSEKEILRGILEEFIGFVIAIRSDEKTAKGTGIFRTEFIHVREDLDNFDQILEKIAKVLESQFSKRANSFKRKMGFPHGIGVQFVPFIGRVNRGFKTIFPLVSVSGLTIQERDDALINYDYGICDNQGFYSKLGDVLERVGMKGSNILGFCYEKGGMVVRKFHDLVSANIVKEKMILEGICKRLIAIARELGVDLYFEVQMIGNFDEPEWAITQIELHEWAKVRSPKEGDLVFTDCKYVHMLTTGEFQLDGTTDLLVPRNVPTKLAIIHTSGLNLARNELFDVGGILDRKAHFGSMVSHCGGVYRALGIPVIGKVSSSTVQRVRGLRERKFTLCLDEINDLAFITDIQ